MGGPDPPSVADPDDVSPAHVAELREALKRQTRIAEALIERSLRLADAPATGFDLFETTIALERRVRERTTALEQALVELAEANAALAALRQEAEEARQRLADAIESSNEGFAIFDASDRLVLCNSTYLGLWPGVSDRIEPGMAFGDIVRLVAESGGTMGARAAPMRYQSERLLQHAFAGKPHIHALPDGRWIQINELRTREGGIVGVYTDVTQLKVEDARARAREMAERSAILQTTLDSIRDGVAVFDVGGRLVAWNEALAAILGLNAGEVPDALGTHAALAALCHRPDFLPGCPVLDWPAPGETAEQLRTETVGDGRTLEVRRRGMPDGGVVISFHDITDSRRVQQALTRANEMLERRVAERTAEAQRAQREAEEANRSKTRFLAAASHDLLQPLNAARLFLSALAERRLAPANRTMIGKAAAALDSVEQLLASLLEISRLDAGAIRPEFVDVELADILGPLADEFLPVARSRGLAYRVEAADARIRTDPLMLRRVLQNLIGNALRYTPAGEVRVFTQLSEGWATVVVADTGPGIPEEARELVFEEFRRLDRPGCERGMGIGLAIVRRMTKLLGHALELESEVGKGSSFRVRVPLARGVAVPAASSPRVNGLPRGLRVLVVDNDAAILGGMEALLGGWGCAVRCAPAGEEALAAARREPPDLMLVDFHLDSETGEEVVLAIRNALGRNIPAVIISADHSPELHGRLASLGLPFLTKPVKPAQVRAMMARLIPSRCLVPESRPTSRE